ncbi:MAG: hypothetical protein ACE5KT_09360 [Methanosarcinales archaeon]
MAVKAIQIEVPEEMYQKIGLSAREQRKTRIEYIKKVISDSMKQENELKDLKRRIASKYASNEISYESLEELLGSQDAERIKLRNHS